MRSPGSPSGHRAPADAGVIEVRVRELGQLFNSMDPSPFHEKELDADAEDYIVSSAKELLTQSPAILLVHLDQPAGLPDEERVLEAAIRVHFARQSQRMRRTLRDLLRRGWKSLAIGLVGGWVAMWRPMEIFLYDWWPILSERRLYDRLSRITVRLVYRPASAAR